MTTDAAAALRSDAAGACYGRSMSITQESTTETDWRGLCACFTTDLGLWAGVELALRSPAQYLEAFPGRLADRGVTTAEGVTPWLALVDWLYENDRLVELDAGDSSHDLHTDLSTLPLLASRIDLSSVAAESVPVEFAVARAAAILAPAHWTLLLLETTPGAYPLALVSTDAAPRIRQLATALGHVARPVDERDTAGPVARGEHGYTSGLPFAPALPSGPRPVNFGKRLLAFLIDAVLLYGVILGGVWLGVQINGSTSGASGVIPAVMASVGGIYLAGLVVLVGRTGRSIGMTALGLKLVRPGSDTPPGYAAAAGRGALTIAVVFGIWLLVVLITTIVDPNGRGLHDKAAGTLMVDTRRKAAALGA